MKKTIKLLPVVLFPYAYLIVVIPIIVLIYNNVDLPYYAVLNPIVGFSLFFVYSAYSLVFCIMNTVKTINGACTVREAAKLNMIVKIGQIPAYIFHFALGLLGLVLSIWGIGLILWAMIIDFLTIVLSGLNALGIPIRLAKEGRMSKGASILVVILNFVYCIDIIVAIVLFAESKKENAIANSVYES